MRVISGKAKGKRIRSLTSGLRPLSNQAKEALFNILMQQVEDCRFLDLFAGTGAVGIEALSRGAKLAVFVEKNRRAVKVIRENLDEVKLDEFGEVYSLDVRAAIRHFKKKQAKFDIVFVGSPYDSPLLLETLGLLSDGLLLIPDSIVVAEHRKQTIIPENIGSVKKIKAYKYGDTILSCYKL